MFVYKYSCMFFDSSTTVPKFGAHTFADIFVEVLFDYCYQCDYNNVNVNNMSAVPHGTFAVCKVRAREMQIAKIQTTEQEQEKLFYSKKYLELTPVKYNSKLMNSIWGLYNRYSVHNFKKMADAEEIGLSAGSQQVTGLPVTPEKPASTKGANNSVLVSDFLNIGGILRSY